MESSPDSVTNIIHHNTEVSIFVNGFEPPASYQRSITYFASHKHIQAIKDKSSQCEQFVNFTCNAADAVKQSYWVDFNGQKKTYEHPESEKCQCRLPKACEDDRMRLVFSISESLYCY